MKDDDVNGLKFALECYKDMMQDDNMEGGTRAWLQGQVEQLEKELQQVCWKRQRTGEILALRKLGYTISQICRETGYTINTVSETIWEKNREDIEGDR